MNGQSLDMEDIMRSTVLFRVLLVVVVVIATRPCLANVKNDFHETNGGNICNYTAQVSRGGLGGGGVGVSDSAFFFYFLFLRFFDSLFFADSFSFPPFHGLFSYFHVRHVILA